MVAMGCCLGAESKQHHTPPAEWQARPLVRAQGVVNQAFVQDRHVGGSPRGAQSGAWWGCSEARSRRERPISCRMGLYDDKEITALWRTPGVQCFSRLGAIRLDCINLGLL